MRKHSGELLANPEPLCYFAFQGSIIPLFKPQNPLPRSACRFMASPPGNPFCGLKLHHAITVGLLCFIAVLSWNANEQRSMDVMVRQAHAYNATVAACPQQAACPACPAAIPAPAVECPASPDCPPSTPTPTSTDICFKQEDFNSMFTARVVKPDGFLSGYLNAVKPSPHYPTFSELAVTGQRAVCTARRLTPRQYDAPAGRGLPA